MEQHLDAHASIQIVIRIGHDTNSPIIITEAADERSIRMAMFKRSFFKPRFHMGQIVPRIF